MSGHYNCYKCGELLGFDGWLWANKPKGTIWKWNNDATEMVFVMNA